MEVVDITDASGATVTVFFDRNTLLPVRQTFRRRNAQFDDFDVETASFAKYRDLKGVKLPLETRRDRNGQKIFEMFVESEEINKSLRDEVFNESVNLALHFDQNAILVVQCEAGEIVAHRQPPDMRAEADPLYATADAQTQATRGNGSSAMTDVEVHALVHAQSPL